MPDPLVFAMCMESMRTRKFLSKPMSIYYEVFLLTTNQRFKLPLSSVASVFTTVIKLPATMSILSHQFKFIVHAPIPVSLPPFDKPLKSTAWTCSQKPLKLSCSSTGSDEDYLIDAPVEIGDGFSFSGGKYADGPSPSDEWFKQGKLLEAHPVVGSGGKAKDPIFGLTMGASSQSSSELFRDYRLKHALYI